MFVHVPDVVSHADDGCVGILEQMVDNHYQVEEAEDIHTQEAVGEGNRAARFKPTCMVVFFLPNIKKC